MDDSSIETVLASVGFIEKSSLLKKTIDNVLELAIIVFTQLRVLEASGSAWKRLAVLGEQSSQVHALGSDIVNPVSCKDRRLTPIFSLMERT